MAKLDDLFKIMVKEGASDLHISSGMSPFFRIHGHMVELNIPSFSQEQAEVLIMETMSEAQSQIFRKELEMDWSYQLPGVGRFRANAFLQIRGMGAVYRMVPEKIKTFEELGLPEILRVLSDAPKGLIIVTGPTGSGKSTTLASLIQHINTSRKEHIITVEDPVEFVHTPQNCLINQREVTRHTRSFANALRSALREDPDVILVGEMRDLETVSLTLTAAETGHLVFATLHTNNAAKSIDRIIDMYPADQQAQIRTMLSESLCAVVSQTLLPRCDDPSQIVAVEILIANSAVRNLIRENKSFQIPSVIQTSAKFGMISFEKSIKNLVDQGKISQATATSFLPALIQTNSD